MIYDRMVNLSRYAPLSPGFGAAVAWLRETPLTALRTDGQKIAIDGDRVFALPQTYDTFTPGRYILESHRRYHDVQVVITGREGMRVLRSDAGVAVTQPYDAQRDVQFYDPSEQGVAVPGLDLILDPGVFAILTPDDLHGPNRTLGPTPSRNRKVVIKVAVEPA